ncbi:hypothetical protein HMPREF1141_3082 [Clostridium sp. MSTE9]|nr:hypothetical protein HMPREF1141_3082 [Clostridium sp. MSTE9]
MHKNTRKPSLVHRFLYGKERLFSEMKFCAAAVLNFSEFFDTLNNLL